MSSNNKIFENSLNKLKEKIKDLDINAKTIISVVRFAMEIVEVTTLKGMEQRKLVEKLVRQIVIDAPISDNKEQALLYMIDEGIVGDIIDLVISATKGDLNINAAVEISKVCCMGFCK
tara:strand:- start:18 stop:371 length:354 start_codon:yes stop_codon:yes gene_type:complete